jgi:DNA-binding XRE family transcriptional regulator
MRAKHWIPAPLASGPLYEARRRHRLSRQALAERSGVSLRTIKRIELGDGGPAYYATLLALGLALGLEPDQLAAAGGLRSGSGPAGVGPGTGGSPDVVGADGRCDLLQHVRDVGPEARS